MTTFAMTDPALRRLFERLDFAPRPKDESLAHLIEYWTNKRNGRVAPTLQDMSVSELGDDASQAFILRIDPRDRAPLLVFGGAAFETLMGPCDPGADILRSPAEARGAVRLRRLVELVRSHAEPVLADFTTRVADGMRLSVEIVVAPLSSSDDRVEGLFGGISVRHVVSGRPATEHARRAAPRKDRPLLFAMTSAAGLGERIARHLGLPLQDHEERNFEDGEHKTRPLVDVRGGDVHIVAGLHGGEGQSVNDRLCRALFFIGALKDAGAARVTMTAPYLCYARKDRRTKPNDPVTTRYLAQVFEAVGTDRIVTMEVHNLAAFQNAFRCSTTHIDGHLAFGQPVAQWVGHTPVAVVSPDIGGAKRAEQFRETLERLLGRPVAKAVADKQRSMGRVSGDLFVGDVSGCIAVIVDDLISTGTTMARVAHQCRDRGARAVWLVAAHGVGGMASLPNLTQPFIDRIVLTNTIPQPRDFVAALGDRLTILDVSGILADALRP
ncbi:ribose-phosphate diphosphokinase [Microvirga subterranea]|uniref:ribose-phosphate diphosphokinase n=1 Tax=Microvirga subterranea TaxID=186651 RepID=A0A370HCY6_9HYPH|nr:ribose-phosphate diphosphokinase [Microvirga subterranea]RDI55101.1 ribose-phosphate pyrophosphokinase [Microvirga subterranea]